MNNTPTSDTLPSQSYNQPGIIPHVQIPVLRGEPLQSEERGASFSDYLRIFKKRKTLVLGTALASTLTAILYCLFTSPLYTAQATLEIKGYAPLLANNQSETLFGNDTRKIEYLKTTIAKLNLEGLADDVLSTNNLAEDLDDYWDARRSLFERAWNRVLHPFSTSEPRSLRGHDLLFTMKPNVIRKYLSLIDVNPLHETNLVSVQATTADPELSQRIANAHALGFISHLQKERQEFIQANLQLLQHQAVDLKAKVTVAEQELSTYAASNKILAVSENNAQVINARQIEALSTLLAEATGKRIKTESLLNEVANKKPDELAVTDDEITRQLRGTLQQTEAEVASLNSKYTGAHPSMMEVRAKVDSLKKAIADERKRAVRTIQTQFSNEKSAETRLRAQIDEEKAVAQEMSKRLIQYNVLAKEAASLRDLYQAVLKQVKEIEISASSSASHVFVTDYASLPTSPSAPKSNLIITLFAIIGVAIGLIVALILEAFDNTLKSSEDVQGALDLPLLGAVPEFNNRYSLAVTPTAPLLPESSREAPPVTEREEDPQQDVSAPHIVSVATPYDVVSEALRTIRAGILLSSADRPPRVIMITSAMKGEGKTTVLYNLAATLAQASHRTIMIDGDLRERGLTKLFCQDQGPGGVGLSNLLTGQAQLDQVIRPTPVKGLDILPAGSKAPNPAELLSSTSMRELISQLSDIYDFILVDSPPILPVADGLTLSRVVDSVVLVVRSRQTERELAQESRRRLLRVNARILGVVLNDLDVATDERDRMMYGGYVTSEESVIT